jgi:hypothetical protein
MDPDSVVAKLGLMRGALDGYRRYVAAVAAFVAGR